MEGVTQPIVLWKDLYASGEQCRWSANSYFTHGAGCYHYTVDVQRNPGNTNWQSTVVVWSCDCTGFPFSPCDTELCSRTMERTVDAPCPEGEYPYDGNNYLKLGCGVLDCGSSSALGSSSSESSGSSESSESCSSSEYSSSEDSSRSSTPSLSSKPSRSHSSADANCGPVGCPGCFSVEIASAFDDSTRGECFATKEELIEYYLGSSFAQICGSQGYCSYYYEDILVNCSENGGPPPFISVTYLVNVCCGC